MFTPLKVVIVPLITTVTVCWPIGNLAICAQDTVHLNTLKYDMLYIIHMSLYTYVYKINPLWVRNIGKSSQTLVYKHPSSKMNVLRTDTLRYRRTNAHRDRHKSTYRLYWCPTHAVWCSSSSFTGKILCCQCKFERVKFSKWIANDSTSSCYTKYRQWPSQYCIHLV